MTKPFNSKEIGEQAIVDFSKIRKKNIREEVPEERPWGAREAVKKRIELAKIGGEDEIEKYRIAVNNFASSVSELALFKNVTDIICPIFIDHILNVVIEPTFKGAKPMGMPEYLFRELRRDIYKDLIDKYAPREENK